MIQDDVSSSVVSVIVALILFFSLIGGLKEGAVKNFFSLIALIIAIPLAGLYYHLIATALPFLPEENLKNFIGFFIALVVISIILHLIFFFPKKLMEKTWSKGVPFRLAGGALNVFSSAIGMTVFSLVVQAYPIFDWLERALVNSSVLEWLVMHLGFIQMLLPETFQDRLLTVAAGSVLSLVNII